jgi:hypothetical protein
VADPPALPETGCATAGRSNASTKGVGITGHSVAEQVIELPWKMPPALSQASSVTSVQVAEASGMQHAPGGCGQRLGEQPLPIPW